MGCAWSSGCLCTSARTHGKEFPSQGPCFQHPWPPNSNAASGQAHAARVSAAVLCMVSHPGRTSDAVTKSFGNDKGSYQVGGPNTNLWLRLVCLPIVMFSPLALPHQRSHHRQPQRQQEDQHAHAHEDERHHLQYVGCLVPLGVAALIMWHVAELV